MNRLEREHRRGKTAGELKDEQIRRLHGKYLAKKQEVARLERDLEPDDLATIVDPHDASVGRPPFGVHKYEGYAALIDEAFDALREDSQAGRRREDIGAGAWV